MYDLLALFDQRAFRADLHDGQFAHLRNGLEGVQRLGLAGEGLGLVLVGENDVDVLAHQPAQEFEVLGHDVEAGQVDGDLQAALLGRTGGLEDQVVVLHQITFDVEAVVPLEIDGSISPAESSSAAPRWVTIVRSPSAEISDTHLPERSLPRK